MRRYPESRDCLLCYVCCLGCREILFNMREESSTEGSSEEEADSLDSEDEDTESPEEKDHLGECRESD